jgi:hypothetical protein
MSTRRYGLPGNKLLSGAMRVVKRVGVALIVVLLLPIVAVHINAEVFRWRAGRLLNRVKTLRVEVTSYSAVSTLRKEYLSLVGVRDGSRG